jgi:hypothetical protein
MQFPRIAAGLLLLAAAGPGEAQQAPPSQVHEVTAQGVVYAVPGMDKVVVRADVPYKKTEAGELKLDLYYPNPPDAKPGGKLPAVVFINGVGDRPDNKLKDWEIYKSWARLVAASGSTASGDPREGQGLENWGAAGRPPPTDAHDARAKVFSASRASPPPAASSTASSLPLRTS